MNTKRNSDNLGLKRRFASAWVLGLLTCFSMSAFAQAWPTKTVRIIVPFTAGGTTDLLTRVVAQAMTEATGQPVIVDNRPGAGGAIGSNEVVRAAPDGYTLLLSTASTHSIAPHLAKLPYNTTTDFTPLVHLADSDLVILAWPGLGVSNISELIDLARKKPGYVNFSSNGVGTISHLTFEMLSGLAGVSMVNVPYKGAGSAITDVSSGLVHIQTDVPATGISHVRAGRVRALAVTGPSRSSLFPDVTPVAETLPGFSSVTWFGLYGPKGMSAELTQRISESVNRVIRTPAMQEKFVAMGLVAGKGSSTDFAEMVAADSVQWGKLIKERSIRVD